jgi:Outer membrane protein beta-barrel domain
MIRRKLLAFPTLLAGVAMPIFAAAEGPPRDIELTPYGGYSFGGTFDLSGSDDTVDLDDSNSVGLLLDVRKDDNTQWEVLYGRHSADANAVSVGASNPVFDLRFDTLQVGGTYQWDGESLRPYLAATLGGIHIDVTNAGYGADTFWSFSVGLGVQYRPQAHLGLRLELRALGTLMNSRTDLFCTTGGATNSCLIQVQGDVLWQTQAFAGLVFRF